MAGRLRPRFLQSAALIAVLLANPAAFAESLSDSLVRAYQNNPQLTAERARQRATDENVPQALSQYRPQIAEIGRAHV